MRSAFFSAARRHRVVVIVLNDPTVEAFQKIVRRGGCWDSVGSKCYRFEDIGRKRYRKESNQRLPVLCVY